MPLEKKWVDRSRPTGCRTSSNIPVCHWLVNFRLSKKQKRRQQRQQVDLEEEEEDVEERLQSAGNERWELCINYISYEHWENNHCCDGFNFMVAVFMCIETSSMSGPFSGPPSLSQERIHGATVNPRSHTSPPWKLSKTTFIHIIRGGGGKVVLCRIAHTVMCYDIGYISAIWYVSGLHFGHFDPILSLPFVPNLYNIIINITGSYITLF